MIIYLAVFNLKVNIEMDFSLSNNNYDFQRYINNNNLLQSSSDSLKVINTFQDLQNYFNNAKETNMLKLYSLEQRFNECLGHLEQFQEEMSEKNDAENEEKVEFQLQRYEDLLHQNFKEIQWIKTERMSEHSNENQSNIIKFQELMQKMDTNLKSIQAQQEALATQLQANIQKQLEILVVKVNRTTEQSLKYQNGVKILLDSFKEQCQQSLQDLQYQLKDLNTELMSKIDIKIQKIQEDLSLLHQ